MSERSLIDVLDGLSEQLKTSTKDVTTALGSFTSEIQKTRSDLHADLTSLTKAIETKMVPSMDKMTGVLEKELPLLRASMTDVQSALKKVFEIQVLPKKK